MTRTAMRVAAVLLFALGTSACSTLDSAYDDVLGNDTPAQQADSNGFPPDQAPAQTADANTPAAPDLAGVPDKPTGTTNPDSQKELADSLAADRNRANYSAQALRGGTEAAAAPPTASEGNVAVADAGAPAGAPPGTPAQPEAAAPPPPTDTSVPAPADTSAAPTTETPAQPVAAAPPPPADATPAPSDAASAPAAAPAPAPAIASAPIAPLPGTTPAVPANGAAPSAPAPMGNVAMSDAQLGFKASTAPALDPSVSQFVAQPIIARYQQTASQAGVPTTAAPVAMADATPTLRHGRHVKAMGGPETMGGSVIANFDALNAPSASPSVYANASGLPPAAVVMFPGDTTKLDASARNQVRAAVVAFQQHGGSGFLKVIGHASSRTGNMPVEKHLMTIFEKSQARAKAVAAEIIREGVPASRVLIEAVGDSQPVYYESMPQGEEGNRRAEIFIQG